ncbi:hypothetical protein [Methylobacterium aquaticum]|uniref:hypothetical protein n=1 Tax=Methylobacterium aquaticum TaxID=270351 RepID=UPI001931C224|nr:hypothetical protein [Methylobacterium aquaticum]QRE73345.1 hypothetical protein F1D61_06615 [Methylobacterium aquaticum]
MPGSDPPERQRRPGIGAAAILDRVPLPLRAVLGRIESGIVDLAKTDMPRLDVAEGAGIREAMHGLRSALSDICALIEAEAHPTVLRAAERLAGAGERLAEMAGRPSRARAAARGAATRALKNLAAALVGVRPSRIAVSLGRGW